MEEEKLALGHTRVTWWLHGGRAGSAEPLGSTQMGRRSVGWGALSHPRSTLLREGEKTQTLSTPTPAAAAATVVGSMGQTQKGMDQHRVTTPHPRIAGA